MAEMHVLEQLSALVRTASAPHTTPTERQAALKALDVFKENAMANFGTCLELFASPDDQLALFAVNAVQYMVRFDLLSKEQMATLRQGLLAIWCSQNVKPFLQDKLGQLIVEVAVREWPQRWPHFMDALFAVPSQKLVATLLTDLVDVIHFQSIDNPNAWDPERKAELQSALVACQEQVCQLFAASPIDINLFCKLAPWYPMSYATFVDVIDAICRGFPDQYASQMAEVLEAMQSRPVRDDLDFMELPIHFVSCLFDPMRDGIIRLSQHDYTLFRNTTCALLTLVAHWLEKRIVVSCKSVFEFAMQCLTLPNLLILVSAFDLVETWVRHEGGESYIKEPLLNGLLTLLSLDAAALIKHNTDDFDVNDEEDSKEFARSLKLLQTSVCDLFKHLGQSPKAYNSIAFLVELAGTLTGTHLRTVLVALDHSLRECKDASVLDIAGIDILMSRLYAAHREDRGVLYDFFSTLLHFVIFQCRQGVRLATILSNVRILFDFLQRDADILDVRCRAFFAVVKLATDAKSCHVIFADSNMIQEIVALGPQAKSQRELRLYVEAVLALALAFPAHRMDLLNCILTPILSQVHQFAVSSIFEQSAMQLLLQRTNLDIAGWRAGESNRASVVNVLTLIQTSSKRLAEFYGRKDEELSILQPVIERFFDFAVCVLTHLLHDIQADKRWHMQIHMRLFEDELEMNEHSEEGPRQDSLDEVLAYANRWYSHLIQIASMILSNLATIPDAHDRFRRVLPSLAELFVQVRKPSSKSAFLRNVFTPLIPTIADWAPFLSSLEATIANSTRIEYHHSVSATLQEKAVRTMYADVVNWLEALMLTQTGQMKQELVVDLSTLEIKDSPIARNGNYWPCILTTHVFPLLSVGFAFPPTNRTKLLLTLHQHLSVLLTQFQDGSSIVASLFGVCLPLLSQPDCQLVTLFLVVELCKWMILAGKEADLRSRFTSWGLKDIDNFIGRLKMATIKGSRNEAKKVFALFMISAKGHEAPKVPKMTEKLVILQKLQKKSTSEIALSDSALGLLLDDK